jgi:hypothetical protein
MFQLIIFCVFDRMSQMDDKEFVLPTEYETSAHAELRALRWMMYRPNDIVMLVSA